MSLSKKAKWVDVIGPATDMGRMLGHTNPVVRRLEDLPEEVPVGAKEAALLTVWAKEQQFAFPPIMEALAVLAALKDWSKEFLVADELAPRFSWKKAPFRKYASFQDFYHRELESTWGTWDNLQATYAEVARGAITEQEGIRRVLMADAADRKNQKQPGAPKGNKNAAKVKTTLDNIQDCSKAPTGTSQARALRCLREKYPAIHARVLAGALSPNAGMIEAGERHKMVSVRADDVDVAIKTLLNFYTREQLENALHNRPPRN